MEVLKGPQGTLFGRNATGGAIRIVTRSPSFTPTAKFSADYGFDFEEINLGAYVSGPLTEQLAASVSASYRTGDGFVEGSGPNVGRHYADPDNYVYRGKLLFKPSDTFKATLAADTWKSNNENVFVATPPDGVNPFPVAGSVATSPYHYAGSTQPKSLVTGDSASLDVTWEAADWLTLRSISGYREIEGEYQSDIDRTSLSSSALALAQNQENFSQEFNFSGPAAAPTHPCVRGTWTSCPADQTITWLFGLYYYHSQAENPYWTIRVGSDAPNGPPTTNFKDNVKTASYAGFGDVTWNATDDLHFTVGARYSTEKKEYFFQNLLPAARPVTNEKRWDSPTYRGVIRYDFGPDANVYASWSNGFKSGVYNAYSSLGIPVNPEKIDAIEIGAKARVGGITFTAAAYDYDYTDLQVQAHATVQGVLVTTLTNAASATIRGFELTAIGNLTDHFSFDVGGSWMPHAEYDHYPTASVVRSCRPTENCVFPVVGVTQVPYDASGSRVLKAPKWSANARLTYSTQLLGGELVGSVSNSYTPGFYWQAGNLTREGAYNVTSLRLAWTDANDRFTYSVWSTNLTDRRYSTYTTPNVRGNSNTYPQPRQVGVGFTANF